jgi:multidrug resistance efflux pump
MDRECPKLRPDVVVVEQIVAGVVAFTMKDPATGRFYRFKEIEGYIVKHLDGRTSLQALRERTERTFNAALPQETLERFIATLARLGLLGTASPTAAAPTRPRRIAGDPFYLRVRIFDPDALFDRLSNTLRAFFTRTFFIVSAASILLAASVTLTSWVDIRHDVAGLLRVVSLFAAWLIVLAVITAHEFAHGLMCKRFGGRVHEIGFLLMYFMPGFYCNVSDAWLFPEKSKRLWVTFAGAYFEIFLWALSTIVWRLTDPHSAINNAALVVMATSGIKTLFNLNPLIKLDGYYLLSDYLEIPNLRWRAFAYLKDRIRARLGFTPRLNGEITKRERKTFVVYGLLSAVYTYWLIATFVIALGAFLISRYSGWGFVLLLAFVAGLFRNRLRVLLHKPLQWIGVASGGNARGKRMVRISLFLVAMAACLFFLRMEATVSGEFTILPIHNADVRAEVDEIIAEVLVDEGDTVQPGDILVRLSGRALGAELRQTRSALEESRAKLAMLKAGPRSEEVSLAKTRVAKAKERLVFAEKDLDRRKTLSDRGLLSQSELERAQEQVSIRDKEIQEETSSLNVLLAGSRPEEIEALEAEIHGLIAQEEYLESQLQLLTVRSPATGVVATPRIKEKAGQHVEKGDLIVEVHELKTVLVEIAVSEKDIADITVGQPVAAKARAYPGSSFQGAVLSIAPIATEGDEWNRERTIRVRASLDNPPLLLRSGMSGNAKIYCGKRPLFELLTRRVLRFIRIDVWSWW